MALIEEIRLTPDVESGALQVELFWELAAFLDLTNEYPRGIPSGVLGFVRFLGLAWVPQTQGPSKWLWGQDLAYAELELALVCKLNGRSYSPLLQATKGRLAAVET